MMSGREAGAWIGRRGGPGILSVLHDDGSK